MQRRARTATPTRGLALLGVDSFEAVRGRRLYSFVVPEHRDAFQALADAAFAGRSSVQEFEIVNAKGDRLRLQPHATPLRTESQEIRAVLAISRDVTGQRKAEEELTRVERLESLALLAGGIAHDFNNLLTVIMANLTLVMNSLPRDGEPYGYLQEAEIASQRTAELTRQLLTFAKGGAPVKAAAVLDDVLRESCGFAVRGSRVRCELALPGSWPVDMDAGQISQAVNDQNRRRVLAARIVAVAAAAGHDRPARAPPSRVTLQSSRFEGTARGSGSSHDATRCRMRGRPPGLD